MDKKKKKLKSNKNIKTNNGREKKEKFYRPPQRLDAGGQHSPALNV
jgi:hypothetical protein